MIHRYQDNCKFCRHYLADQQCQAFPAGILTELWSGENLHRGPYPDDQGYRYEPRDIGMLTVEDLETSAAA